MLGASPEVVEGVLELAPLGCSVNDQGTSCMMTLLLAALQHQGQKAAHQLLLRDHMTHAWPPPAGENACFCQLVCALFEPWGAFAQSCSLVRVARWEGRKYSRPALVISGPNFTRNVIIFFMLFLSNIAARIMYF